MFSYCRYQLQIVLPSVVFFVILFYLSAHTQQNIAFCVCTIQLLQHI